MNDAKIDVMFSAHIHRWAVYNVGDKNIGANFPIVVNANRERLEVTISGDSMSLSSFDTEGKCTHQFNL